MPKKKKVNESVKGKKFTAKIKTQPKAGKHCVSVPGQGMRFKNGARGPVMGGCFTDLSAARGRAREMADGKLKGFKKKRK